MTFLPYLANVLAICILVFAIYLPRHHRRDLAVAFLGVNIGVMTVSVALLGVAASVGLGLGLFGVLSIIRLRSDELAQHEVAYYFSALALGLIGGIGSATWTTVALMALIVGVMAGADHPAFRSSTKHEVVHLDHAITDDAELRRTLTERLGAQILSVSVTRIDFVNDTTTVDVRLRTAPTAHLPVGLAR